MERNWLFLDFAPVSSSGGSLFLYNKRVLKFYRKDGHHWKRKKDGKAIAEAHERLKVFFFFGNLLQFVAMFVAN